MTGGDPAQLIAGECIAVRVRLLNRALTRMYDAALRPLGLRVSQMSVLVAVARHGRARPGDVCRALSMDKSTLSRDVERLKARGWLETAAGDDARSHTLSVTPAGLDLLQRVVPAWQQAQRRAADLLGPQAVAALDRAARGVWKDAAAG
jgi:DNA-binding MarR family transcriptional regulator